MERITEDEILEFGFYNANDPFLGRAYYSEETITLDENYNNAVSYLPSYDYDPDKPEGWNVIPKYLISERLNLNCFSLIVRHSWANWDVEHFVTLKELVDLMNVKK